MINAQIYIYSLILSILLCFTKCSTACIPKVAVIGGGIGGASASHFLTELFQNNVEIDVFEAKKVGGRLATIELENHEFEAGGAVIHPRNKYMSDFVKMLNLEHRPPLGGNFGIWNGKELLFEESNWEAITLLKLLYRYGTEPYYLHKYVDSILNDFERIYDLQDKGFGFENVTALLGAMNKDFVDLMGISIKDHLLNLGYGTKLIDELVQATLVVNYGQDTNVHAFVSSVSVAGAGFNLWSVKGGNKEVPRHLIDSNKKVSLIRGTVKKVSRSSSENGPSYEIFYQEDDKDNILSGIYDIVIIAAPMTNDQETHVIFHGFDKTELQFKGEYQTTYATFVSGNVNFSYFGLEEKLGGILSCNPVETKISSIGRLSSVDGTKDDETQVWKIFSREKLSTSMINQMFSKVEKVKEIRWKAYPRYSSTLRFDKFKLDDLMYYVNAIEWAASAMEMSAIGGRNAAILAYNDYQQKCSSSTVNNFNSKSITTHSPEL